MGRKDEYTDPVVDPEVRAYIGSLVSALGGSGAEEDGRYMLGDDTLACLKDIKKWLKFYDEKTNRLDVARCLAEARLVEGDLIEILALSPESEAEDRLKWMIAIACIELLGHLTWPVEFDDEHMTINHHRHLPYIRLSQVRYKAALLTHASRPIRTAIKVSLPSIALQRPQRSSRDEGVIKLLLYFLRNLAIISFPKDVASDGSESEISRSATIESYQKENVFQLILTIASSLGDDFSDQDVIILETLFHLVKGINPESLFSNADSAANVPSEELQQALRQEKAAASRARKSAATRHNRFGTMMWLDRGQDKYSTLSGQRYLGDLQTSLRKVDLSKKWNKPTRTRVNPDESVQRDLGQTVNLSETARQNLSDFTKDFLDSSFNPLFSHLRKAIEREVDRVQDIHSTQYFYLMSWFLQAHRSRMQRIRSKKDIANMLQVAVDECNYGLVAAVLNQETFILLNRYLQKNQDEKLWPDLTACMRCFTQILLTVQVMSASSEEDDQEISENIQSRIFYEESTHDCVMRIVKSYKDQGFAYLDACTELSHVFVRLLEQYSKQNEDMQIRSRRRQRTKRRKETSGEEGLDIPAEEHESEAEDLQEAKRISRERKFDFARYSARFVNQSSVNTYVALLRFYQDLDEAQLKRVHRFFHRVAFKMDMSTLLFRIDIIHLIHQMIRGSESLSMDLAIYAEWEEFSRQFFRKFLKIAHERRALLVEILFSKMPSSVFYLEHGYDKYRAPKTSRLPPELEVIGLTEKSDQVWLVVSEMVMRSQTDYVDWVKQTLRLVADHRKVQEDSRMAAKNTLEDETGLSNEPSAEAPSTSQPYKVSPVGEERRLALKKSSMLRLLLSLLDFECLDQDGENTGSYQVTSTAYPQVSSLLEAAATLEKYLSSPFQFAEGKSAEDFFAVKRPNAPSADQGNAVFSSDDDDNDSDPAAENDFLFEAGGPTARPNDRPSKVGSSRRRHRQPNRKNNDLEERPKARRKLEAKRRQQIKSDLYVRDSDDEDNEERDREFFELEEQRRQGSDRNVTVAVQKRSLVDDDVSQSESKGAKRARKWSHQNKSRQTGHSSNHDSDDSNAQSDDASSATGTVISDAASGKDSDAGTSSSSRTSVVTPENTKTTQRSNPDSAATVDTPEKGRISTNVNSDSHQKSVRANFVIASDSDSE